MKKIFIVLAIICISFLLYFIYVQPNKPVKPTSTVGEDSMAWMENEMFHPDDSFIPEQYRGKKEWVPVQVIYCEEVDDGQFEITFANDYFIVSDTMANVGDTNRCWVNTWYFSKEFPTSDSVVFENPYQK